MRNSIACTLSLAAFALLLAGGTARAQDKGHGHDRDVHPSKSHGNDRDHDRGRATPSGHVPPGLAKKGGVPPGLAKKGGVPPGQLRKSYRPDDGASVLRDVFGRHGYTVLRTVPNGDSRYVYYRYHTGAVHRAVVRPGNDQLYFSNVPSALLTEVLARLR